MAGGRMLRKLSGGAAPALPPDVEKASAAVRSRSRNRLLRIRMLELHKASSATVSRAKAGAAARRAERQDEMRLMEEALRKEVDEASATVAEAERDRSALLAEVQALSSEAASLARLEEELRPMRPSELDAAVRLAERRRRGEREEAEEAAAEYQRHLDELVRKEQRETEAIEERRRVVAEEEQAARWREVLRAEEWGRLSVVAAAAKRSIEADRARRKAALDEYRAKLARGKCINAAFVCAVRREHSLPNVVALHSAATRAEWNTAAAGPLPVTADVSAARGWAATLRDMGVAGRRRRLRALSSSSASAELAVEHLVCSLLCYAAGLMPTGADLKAAADELLPQIREGLAPASLLHGRVDEHRKAEARALERVREAFDVVADCTGAEVQLVAASEYAAEAVREHADRAAAARRADITAILGVPGAAERVDAECVAGPPVRRRWMVAAADNRVWVVVAGVSGDEQWAAPLRPSCPQLQDASGARVEVDVHGHFGSVAEDIAADVQRALAPLRGRRILCGHSGGGAIAGILAHVIECDSLVTFGCPKFGVSRMSHPGQHHYMTEGDYTPRGLGCESRAAELGAAAMRVGLDPGVLHLDATQQESAKYCAASDVVRVLPTPTAACGRTRAVECAPAAVHTACSSLWIRPTGIVEHDLGTYVSRLWDVVGDEFPSPCRLVQPPSEADAAAAELRHSTTSGPWSALASAHAARAVDAHRSRYPLLRLVFAAEAASAAPLNWHATRRLPLLRLLDTSAAALRKDRLTAATAECTRAERGVARLRERVAGRERDAVAALDCARFWGLNAECTPAGTALDLTPLNLVFRAARRDPGPPGGWRKRGTAWRAEGTTGLRTLYSVARDASPLTITANVSPYPCKRLGLLFKCVEETRAQTPVLGVLWAVVSADCPAHTHTDLSQLMADGMVQRRRVRRERSAVLIQQLYRRKAAKAVFTAKVAVRDAARRAHLEAERRLYERRSALLIVQVMTRHLRRLRAASAIQRMARCVHAKVTASRLRSLRLQWAEEAAEEEARVFEARGEAAAGVLQRCLRAMVARRKVVRRRRVVRAAERAAEEAEQRLHQREERAAALLGRAVRRRMALTAERRRLFEFRAERDDLRRLMGCERRMVEKAEAADRAALGPHDHACRLAAAAPGRQSPDLFDGSETEASLAAEQTVRLERIGRTAVAAEWRGVSAAVAACAAQSRKEAARHDRWVWRVLAPVRCLEEGEWRDAQRALRLRVRSEQAGLRQQAELRRIAGEAGDSDDGGDDAVLEEASRRAQASAWWASLSQNLRESQKQRSDRFVDDLRAEAPEQPMAGMVGAAAPEPGIADRHVVTCVGRMEVSDEEALRRLELEQAAAAHKESVSAAQREWWTRHRRTVSYVRSASARVRRPVLPALGRRPGSAAAAAAASDGTAAGSGAAGTDAAAPTRVGWAEDTEDPLADDEEEVPVQVRAEADPTRQAIRDLCLSLRRPSRRFSVQSIDFPQRSACADVQRVFDLLRPLRTSSVTLDGGYADEHATAVCGLLSDSPSVPERLSLRDNSFSSVAFAAVVHEVSQCRFLKVVDLSRSLVPLTDDGDPPVFGALASDTCGVTHLTLDGNGLPDASVLSLAAFVAVERAQFLSVAENSAGDLGAHVLLEGLTRRASPFDLNISGNAVSQTLLVELQSRLQLLTALAGMAPRRMRSAALPPMVGPGPAAP